MTDTGIIEIHGKDYRTVPSRLKQFREDKRWEGWRLETDVTIGKASVLAVARAINPEGVTIATGHAHEAFNSSMINKTSAVENAETSAVGRCLAFLSPDLAGTQIASAEEVEAAKNLQSDLLELERLKGHNECVREHWESIHTIKTLLAENDYSGAYEAIHELKRDYAGAWESLWKAPSKGGVWLTAERAQIRSNEMNAAMKAYHGEAA